MLKNKKIVADSMPLFASPSDKRATPTRRVALSAVLVASIVLASGCAPIPYQGQYSGRAPQYQSYQPYAQSGYQTPPRYVQYQSQYQPQYEPQYQTRYQQYPQNSGYDQYQSAPQYQQGYASPDQSVQGNPVAGAIVGAGVGALAGHYLSKKGDKTSGTLMGTAIGGVLGGVIGNGVPTP
ncbi:MAG: glycine zipper 2TM domain-containing protein [Halothiobacillus sp.]